MAYNPLGPFTNVPDGTTPPAGAVSLDAAALDYMEEGIRAAAATADAAGSSDLTLGTTSTTAAAGNDPRIVNAVRAVNHGTIASVARPTGAVSVTWIGSVEPANMTDADLWIAPA